ncbi:hypothetical protein BJX70DRAFT_227981 [Aspergillus crustosus]
MSTVTILRSQYRTEKSSGSRHPLSTSPSSGSRTGLSFPSQVKPGQVNWALTTGTCSCSTSVLFHNRIQSQIIGRLLSFHNNGLILFLLTGTTPCLRGPSRQAIKSQKPKAKEKKRKEKKRKERNLTVNLEEGLWHALCTSADQPSTASLFITFSVARSI